MNEAALAYERAVRRARLYAALTPSRVTVILCVFYLCCHLAYWARHGFTVAR